MELLEKLVKTAKTISTDNKFLLDVKVYTNIDKYIGDIYKPFKTTQECRQYIIAGIENGTLKTKDDIYKIFGLKIIYCKSGEILAYIQ